MVVLLDENRIPASYVVKRSSGLHRSLFYGIVELSGYVRIYE